MIIKYSLIKTKAAKNLMQLMDFQKVFYVISCKSDTWSDTFDVSRLFPICAEWIDDLWKMLAWLNGIGTRVLQKKSYRFFEKVDGCDILRKINGSGSLSFYILPNKIQSCAPTPDSDSVSVSVSISIISVRHIDLRLQFIFIIKVIKIFYPLPISKKEILFWHL